jgi:hypothetical protein
MALVAVLAVPAAAVAQEPTRTDKTNAAKECKALLKAAGSKANLASTLGLKVNKNAKNAYGKCVSKLAREEAAERKSAQSNASKDCKAEAAMTDDQFKADPAHQGKTFAEFYGAKNAKSAHGKCVSTKAKQNKTEADQKDQDRVSASKFCKGEQSKPEFKTTYRNFGACVSKKAHELNAARKQAQTQTQSS